MTRLIDRAPPVSRRVVLASLGVLLVVVVLVLRFMPTLLGAVDVPTISASACAGVGLPNATLAGDAHDPRIAWLVQNGQRRDVVFPDGFHARFAPNLEILDGSGAIVARAGDAVTGACVTGDGSAPLLLFLGQ
jgi:hypothetical protein